MHDGNSNGNDSRNNWKIMILGIAGLPQDDLDTISGQVEPFIGGFKNTKILVYGGTGFVGSWLIGGLLNANLEFSLNLEISIVTRNVARAIEKFRLNSEQLNFVECDLSISEPRDNSFADFVFLGSTPTRTSTGSSNFEAVLKASANAANHASNAKSNRFDKPFVLHLSSGAIYGKQSMDMIYRSETDPVLRSSPDSYIKSKLLIDEILNKAHVQNQINFNSPRLFAFAGPLITLNEHFAVGNFINDVLNGREIQIKGNPNTVRSYMYPTDLICILLKLIQSPSKGDVNIGSDEPVRMADLAAKISDLASSVGIRMSNPGDVPSNYVPSIKNLRDEIWPSPFVTLDLSLEKWIYWLKTKDLSSSKS
jgi:dTDP-glucose 4,6-dehydratase